MRINSITNHYINNQTNTERVFIQTNHILKNSKQDIFTKTSSVSFRASACEIERMLARKGISCDFAGNSFVADCVRKTVDVFEKLYGKSSLPKEVNFRNLYGSYGIFNPYTDEVAFDSGSSCFDILIS